MTVVQLGVHRFENQIRRKRRCDNIWTKILKMQKPLGIPIQPNSVLVTNPSCEEQTC